MERDKDETRRTARLELLGKYQWLEDPPKDFKLISHAIVPAEPGSNDEVDNDLLVAVAAPAVDYLITEDKNILRKASGLGLSERVITLKEAVEMLESLFDRPAAAPPSVEDVKPYLLDLSDRIWESFRLDYPGFDDWLRKCMLEHRQTWLIKGPKRYDAIAIVNKEARPPAAIRGRVLKLCSFKVSEESSGYKFGELLLKTIFRYATTNRYDWIFVEAFDRHASLIQLLELFGFRAIQTSSKGELVLAKPMNRKASNEPLSGLDFNIRFGPEAIDWEQDAFIVPIQPTFDELLFPDQQHGFEQSSLFAGDHPFGNAMRKAYLCHSNITKLVPGSILLFYRSADLRALTSVGVMEEAQRLSDPLEIATLVGRRTVYSFEQISDMARKPVLSILFRHARPIDPVIRLRDLVSAGVLKAAPESIVSVSESAKQWIVSRLDQSPS